MGITELDTKYKDYEKEYSFSLEKKPFILRLDGKSFSKLTHSVKQDFPFNMEFIQVMNETATYLASNIQDCVLGFIQSDEISLLLVPTDNPNSQLWFDGKIQKILSITASWAGAYFSANSNRIFGKTQIAAFDCRIMAPPENEIIEIFNWRQKDGIRNSVQMFVRSMYSHSQCNGKSLPELKQMVKDKGVDWDYLPDTIKYGRMVYKKPFDRSIVHPKTGENIDFVRNEWVVEKAINFSKDLEVFNNLVRRESK